MQFVTGKFRGLVDHLGIDRPAGYRKCIDKGARAFGQVTESRIEHHRQGDAAGRRLVAGQGIARELFEQKRIAARFAEHRIRKLRQRRSRRAQ